MSSYRSDEQPVPTTVATATPHHGVDSALTYLTVVLADPSSGLVDDDLADEVADVVSSLVDVNPPLPPLRYPCQGADDDQHALALVAHARRRLHLTAIGSEDRAERLRAAVASHRLRALLVQWAP